MTPNQRNYLKTRQKTKTKCCNSLARIEKSKENTISPSNDQNDEIKHNDSFPDAKVVKSEKVKKDSAD